MQLQLREDIAHVKRLPRNDDVLAQRSELLSRVDHDLIDAIVVRGQTVGAIARLMGVTPRSLRERVFRLTRRMTSEPFLSAARMLPYLEPADAAIAAAAYCQGLSQRKLCKQLNLTSHALRRRLDRISARIDTIGRLTAPRTRLAGGQAGLKIGPQSLSKFGA